MLYAPHICYLNRNIMHKDLNIYMQIDMPSFNKSSNIIAIKFTLVLLPNHALMSSFCTYSSCPSRIMCP